MSTEVVVFHVKETYTTNHYITDNLGREQLNQIPGQVGSCRYPLTNPQIALYFGDMPALSWRGAGTAVYEEWWIALVDPGLSAVGSGGAGGAFDGNYIGSGPSILATNDYLTASGVASFRSKPTSYKLRRKFTTPTATYDKTVGPFPYGLVTELPSSGDLEFYGATAGGLTGPLDPGWSYFGQVASLSWEFEHYGDAIPFAAFDLTVAAPSVPGRYVHLEQGPGSIFVEWDEGNPFDNTESVEIRSFNQWIDPWSYDFRFDLLDTEGNHVSKPVLFLSKVYEGKLPSQVTIKSGSFLETVSQDFQWIKSHATTRLNFSSTEHEGHSTILSGFAQYPLAGVMVPGSSLNGTVNGDSAIDRWTGNDWITSYTSGNNEETVPLLGIVRPDQRAKWISQPFESPKSTDSEFTLRSVKLKQRTIWSHQPSPWTMSAALAGSSVSGSTLTAGEMETMFVSIAGSNYGAVHPYRYLTFDTEADHGGTIEVILEQISSYGVTRKLYRARVDEGSGKVWVDTCKPLKLFNGPFINWDWTSGADLPRTDGQNIESPVGGTFYAGEGRFSGVFIVRAIYLIFSNNIITVSNFGGEVKDAARARLSAPIMAYDPGTLTIPNFAGGYALNTSSPQYLFYGDVDGKDAFRSLLAVGKTTWPTADDPFTRVASVDPLPTVFLTPPSVTTGGELFPLVDMVNDGIDVKYSYGYGQLCSTFIGAEKLGIFGDGASYHASLIWGNGQAVTTASEGDAEITRQTFDDGGTFTEDLTYDTTGRNGYAEKKTTWFFPDSLTPLNWAANAPYENYGSNKWQNFHFRLLDKNQTGDPDYVKHNESLSFGAMYWLGMLPKYKQGTVSPWNMVCDQNIAPRYHRAFLQDGNIQYWRAGGPSAFFGWDSQEELTDTGDCRDPRMAQKIDRQIILVYSRDGLGSFYRVSNDNGKTFNPETSFAEDMIHPTVSSLDGFTMKAALLPDDGFDGPGVIRATLEKIGTTTAEITLTDETGADIRVENDTFHLVKDTDGRWHLTAVAEGETEPSDWFSTDEANLTFKKITP